MSQQVSPVAVRHHPDQDEFFMRQAIALAQNALYVPAPNPRVGCVIARDGQVLARGSTQHVGGAHAEIMALRDLERQGLTDEGATV